MKWILTVLMVSAASRSFSQASLHVEKSEIRIGDQIEATIEVHLRDNQEWINREQIWPDSMAGIEVASGPSSQASGDIIPSLTWKLSFFDTGWVRIPALPVHVRDRSQVDTFFTLDVPVHVLPVLPDSAGLREIKEIFSQPFSITYYKKFIPHLLGIALIFIAFVIWIRRKKKTVPVSFTPPPLKPHEWAFGALDELEQKRLWQAGEVKAHYSELTGILRGYLERAFGIHALEQTTDEIIAQMKSWDVSSALLMDTASLLSMADMVKFAKADPGINIHADAIERVRTFVTRTIPATGPEELNTTDHADMA